MWNPNMKITEMREKISLATSSLPEATQRQIMKIEIITPHPLKS